MAKQIRLERLLREANNKHIQLNSIYAVPHSEPNNLKQLISDYQLNRGQYNLNITLSHLINVVYQAQLCKI